MPDRITKNQKIYNPRSLRNLPQYRNMGDDEFEDFIANRDMDMAPDAEFDRRINKKIEQFSDDYDLSDMKINDQIGLRALAQAMITLDDLEHASYKLRREGLNLDNITLADKIAKQMSDLRNDIIRIQDDLKISRKARKGDKEETVQNYLKELKEKAKEFYEERMTYVFCPECDMLLGTVWFHYPEDKNTLRFTCHRKLPDGSYCNTVVTTTSKELLEKRGTNKPEILPESML
jgi:hypothetical protein